MPFMVIKKEVEKKVFEGLDPSDIFIYLLNA